MHTKEVRAAESPECKAGLLTATVQHFVKIVKTQHKY